jgi:uncharacterized protein (TIGR03118 family)
LGSEGIDSTVCTLFKEELNMEIDSQTVRGRSILNFVLGAALVLALGSTASAQYQQKNLVSDLPNVADNLDTNLVNSWGIAFPPTGPFWISDNGAGVSTLYNGDGDPFPLANPLVVTIPPPAGGTISAPTGVIFNGTTDFVVSANLKSGAARFIFATEDGTISGWNPSVDATNAILAVDNSPSNAVYKGLAMAVKDGANFLYATDFHNGFVQVFDSSFNPAGTFTDDGLPAGFAPFGIRNLGGKLFVTFAVQDADAHDDVKGPGNGFVDVFDPAGHLIRRLISHGALNSPWGLEIAPGGFGPLSKKLLVGNFGDGKINSYVLPNGHFIGPLRDTEGSPVTIDGLWALTFGNGSVAGQTRDLFFTAGPNDEQDGLFGRIRFEPAARGGDRGRSGRN